MKIKTVEYSIKDIKIPKELSGYRIALFSDTHNMNFGNDYEDLYRPIANANPDIVIFAGDAVNKNLKSKKADGGYENAVDLFQKIATSFPLYYVNGNHDRRFERLSYGRLNYANYIRDIKNAGVRFLSNESTYIEDGKIKITGLDLPLKNYAGKGVLPSVKYLNELIDLPDENAYNILIAHTPKYFDKYASWGADLVLCGHIHGGLLRLPGKYTTGKGKPLCLLSPHKEFFPKYSYGLYHKADSNMIVSSGAGDHNFRFTLCNPYEICIITLESEA